MASNRAQRRAAYKKGKRPGETYADQLARQREIKEAIEKTARDETVALETDIKSQRLLWMAVVANNIAFGHAGIRSQRFMLALDEVREDLEEMAGKNGWEYAVEKLREQCEKITGMEVRQVHEDRMIQARKENEAKGVFFPAEDPEELARIGFTSAAPGPKWISVKDRLPKYDGRYMANIRSYAFKGCYFRDIVTFEHGQFQGECIGSDDVTHWAELPGCPKELVHG